MPYRSHGMVQKVRRARTLALIAAAEVVLNALKERHRGGYTSGDFVTGNTLNSFFRTDPEPVAGGDLRVRVTTRQTDPPYPWFWTIGHMNLFTRRWERVDHWTPALADSAIEARETYARVFAQELAA